MISSRIFSQKIIVNIVRYLQRTARLIIYWSFDNPTEDKTYLSVDTIHTKTLRHMARVRARLAADMGLYEYSIIHKILLRANLDLDGVILYSCEIHTHIELEIEMESKFSATNWSWYMYLYVHECVQRFHLLRQFI